MEFAPRDFATLFGCPEGRLPDACQALALAGDFRYDLPQDAQRDRIILQVLQNIESDALTQVGPQRAEIWESCWSDNLRRFVEAGYNPLQLVPDFIRPDQPVRLNRAYVIPASPRFELDFFRVCRAYLFERFFSAVRSVYEFGCGSGFNLVAFAEQIPGRKLYGLDWAKSSCETVNLVGEKLGIDLAGRRFDFFAPDRGLELDPDSGVLTMCALEQVGRRHGRFVNYLLEKSPRICVHMEPLLELYDEAELTDYLAARYHRKRGYLDGFLSSLRDLAAKGRIELLEARRFLFGSIFHEAYSYVAWRPL